MGLLTRETLKQGFRLDMEKLEIPEWGTTDDPAVTYIREMTVAERNRVEHEAELVKQGKKGNVKALVAVICCCDETGERVFAAKDIDRIGGMPAAGLDRILRAALRVSKLDQDDRDELEDLAKN